MSTTILIKKDFSHSEILKACEAPGKPAKRVAGGWIHDLCAQRQVVLLCPFCTHKFNPGRLGYIKEKELCVAIGKCDGCGVLDTKCSTYFWEETYKQVRCTSDERRALMRSREKRIAKGNLG